MKLSTLTQREQIIVTIVVIALVLFLYGFFRFLPQKREIASLETMITKIERKLSKARVPDEPTEGLDELIKQLEDQEKTLSLLQGMSDKVMQSLAPEGSQELKVLISQLASDNQIRIKKNEIFTPSVTLLKSNNTNKKKKKKQKTSNSKSYAALPATYNWIQRMAPGTPFYRPLQRMILHCDYPSLRKFIYGLSTLPWQVTVVRLKIEKLPEQPLRGTTQRLQIELILAL